MEYGYYLRVADQAKQIYLSEDIYMSEKAEFHDSIEFVFVLEGEISAEIGGKTQILSPGMICFANSYENHCYRQMTEKSDAYVLVLSSEYTREFKALYGDMSFKTFMLNVRMNEELFGLMKTWIGIKERTYLKNFAYANLLFATIVEKYGLMRHKKMQPGTAVKTLLLYIHEHYLEDITLQSISKNVGYSPDYCARVLKKNLAYDFKTYLHILRFRKAKELLGDRTLQYNVNEVAKACGFRSSTTYYRAKKRLEERGLIEKI